MSRKSNAFRALTLGFSSGLIAAVTQIPGAQAATTVAPFNETFAASVPFSTAQPATGTFSNFHANCVEHGISTFSFTVTGPATGNYPGTFSEQVVYKFDSSLPIGDDDQSTNSYGRLTAYDATFTVTSGSTQITGEKHLIPGAEVSTTAQCLESPGNATVNLNADQSVLQFTAEIVDSSGRYRDTGTSGTDDVLNYPPPRPGGPTGRLPYGQFNQSYASDGAPQQELPTSKDDCKNGGWQKYGVFKNQGDCVSYVSTHGKNPPAGG